MNYRKSIAILAVVLALAAAVTAQDRSRASIPEKYKWNLADLYASEGAWREAKDKLKPQIATIAPFKGTLGTSPARLADALDTVNRVAKELQRVFIYASLLSDEDTRVAKNQGMQQEMQQIGAGVWRGGRVRRARDPEDRQGEDRRVDRAGSQAEDVQALPRRHPAPPAAHVERCGGTAARLVLGRDRRVVVDLQHSRQRRLSVPVGDAERWQDRQAGLIELQPVPRRCRIARIGRKSWRRSSPSSASSRARMARR